MHNTFFYGNFFGYFKKKERHKTVSFILLTLMPLSLFYLPPLSKTQGIKRERTIM